MLDYQAFTIDQQRFPLDRMQIILSQYNYIPIIQVGIGTKSKAYFEGLKRNIFVKDALGQQLHGKVWQGITVFVDFLNPNATKYWGDMLDTLYNKIKFSGVWLDMNQYANSCNGPCQIPKTLPKFDYSKDLPYNPGNDSIESHTIPLNSTHYGDFKEADVHAFNGFLQTYATNVFLKSKNLRPFIISRSSSLGSNKYGFHWTGDNYASFQFLKGSISDNFLNQMWGFQMVGPDICGFGGNTTQQLCSRWFQLGSLYTFTRSHNDNESISQEPYALGEIVKQSARTNLKLRYSLLKHYYSIFVQKKGFGTIFNPVFFIFPLNINNYLDEVSDTQFLIGDNLMAAPILQQGVTSRNVYFSSQKWFNFHSGQLYNPGIFRIENIKLTDKVPLFIRQGTLVLTQNTENIRKTRQLGHSFTIVAGLHYDSQISNLTHQYFTALGSHISLNDYSNDKNIDLCLIQGCNYGFNLLLSMVNNGEKSLTITVNYTGGQSLNQIVQVNQFKLYCQGKNIIKIIKSFDNLRKYKIRCPD